jgi:CHAD domain-containing protein
VHDARVATRRLREALPVVARGKKGRALLKAVRRITRALGPVRELDVALTTLAEFGASKGVSRDSIVRVRTAIAEERRRLCARLSRRLARGDVKGLGQRVVDQTSVPLTTQAARALLADVEGRCGRRAARLRGAIETAAGIYLPDRLHDVRIRVKKLRYAMELAQDLRNARRTTRPARASGSTRAESARLRTLRHVQDLLGRMNDLEVIIARMRALQGTSTVTGLSVSADLDQLVRRLENECRVLHGKYMTARGSLLAVCDYAEATIKKRERASQAA